MSDRGRGILLDLTTLADIEAEMERTNETDFIIDGLIHSGMTTIVGDPFLGKTYLALEVIRSLTTGAPLFGREVLGEPRKVIYLTTDPKGERTLARRARALGLDMDAIYAESFYTPEGSREWKDIVRDLQDASIGFVVLDNTTDLALDANAPKEVKQITDGLRRIIDAGCGLLNIHHRNSMHGDFGSMLWVKSTRAKLDLRGRVKQSGRRLLGTFNDAGDYEWTLRFDPRAVPAFSLVSEKDTDQVQAEAEERAEAEARKRDRATLDRNADIARFVVETQQGQSLRKAAVAISKRFPGIAEGTARNSLSQGRAFGALVKQQGAGNWTLGGPLAEEQADSRLVAVG